MRLTNSEWIKSVDVRLDSAGVRVMPPASFTAGIHKHVSPCATEENVLIPVW